MSTKLKITFSISGLVLIAIAFAFFRDNSTIFIKILMFGIPVAVLPWLHIKTASRSINSVDISRIDEQIRQVGKTYHCTEDEVDTIKKILKEKNSSTIDREFVYGDYVIHVKMRFRQLELYPSKDDRTFIGVNGELFGIRVKPQIVQAYINILNKVDL